PVAAEAAPAITTADVVAIAKKNLTQAQATRVLQLENSVVRGDVKVQQVKVLKQLAEFWGDTARQPSIGAFYFGEAAKLENSEKNLTFAAHLLLNNAMADTSAAMQTWQATQAKALFEKALQLNPANDSSKVGLGACYLFGNISATPMQGIMAIREVAERDTNNMYAQMMLGLGGVKSGQLDKAIERFLTVVRKQPHYLEAVINLAEAYDRKGDRENAVKWYKAAAGMVDIPDLKKEIENRIKALQ
ncbi:MAG TPA: tetratricopeptide repeat protein, partial [Chitinophagaceae bacterium]|nr:tetratricopeptide repeat protein [Chitinophagaceae bacterium]